MVDAWLVPFPLDGNAPTFCPTSDTVLRSRTSVWWWFTLALQYAHLLMAPLVPRAPPLHYHPWINCGRVAETSERLEPRSALTREPSLATDWVPSHPDPDSDYAGYQLS
ncbi:hypothetical protein HZ326_3633 [Fusarium oxysporum f. sp. albedinis]|nr:hypothetical protein HZ326_3633 [Fusarium oxysporum f. sp. albedinis]